ncbi:Acyl Carrier Protein [Zostera marina]|uniref:Acyl carrier protein n=1 Tax=Zostera marina TaxID=29655 RepID=A0A0K9PHA2_ZOSMR|nr:Acyl Carrier Protein [Zostera marina]
MAPTVAATLIYVPTLSISLKQRPGVSGVFPTSSVLFPRSRRIGSHRLRVSCAAKPETVDKVCEIVKKQLALGADQIVNGESKFSALGADSLDTVEIVMGLEEEFGITVEEESAQTIATVQDAADMIDNLCAIKQ